uniref:Uncharacterized protein n=1 Tax=Panagrolaimus superbus TaxID=310955 RepID=A0A914YVD4_9BILA
MIPWIFGYFLLYFFVAASPISENNSSSESPTQFLKATTIIAVFNATFSWKIENINLFDFGTNDHANTLLGPTLSAVDQKNDNKVYSIDFAISPEWIYNRQNYHELPKYELKKYDIISLWEKIY